MATPEILVVDDSLMVHLFLKAVLPQHGLAVCNAYSGEEALDIYRRRGDAISLVLLDIHMPGLDGPQTFIALRELNPSVRCCFMSADLGGYWEEELMALG